MPRPGQLHPDPVMAAIETAQAPRQFIIRLLSRWPGWATTSNLLDAYTSTLDEPLARDAFDKALSRLVRQGKVLRVGTHNTGRYRLAAPARVVLEHRTRRAMVCSICGARGNARGHANGHLPWWQLPRSART